MKPALHLFPRAVLALLICSLLALLELPATAEPLSLKHAIELALTHSPAAAQAGANQQRAFASYREARNQFIPQMLVGSGLGDSWGYPLALEGAAPSLVNITAQSPLLNPALRDFVRAARTEYKATAEDAKDRRNQVIQDTVLTYLELVKWEKLIDHLQAARSLTELPHPGRQAGSLGRSLEQVQVKMLDEASVRRQTADLIQRASTAARMAIKAASMASRPNSRHQNVIVGVISFSSFPRSAAPARAIPRG